MKKRIIDLAERAAATFAQAFLAIQLADQAGVTQLSALKVGAVAGGLAVAKWALVQVNAYLASTPSVPAA